jgi:hypothetical protein
MEIGGGKYVASWRPALFTETERDTSAAGYYFASQVQEKNVPIAVVTLGANNPPLTWLSFAALQTATGFEKQRDELNLLYPNTDVSKAAVNQYVHTLKQYCDKIVALRRSGKDIPLELSEAAPAFPEPYYNQWVSRTETATHTYNFCISPLTPFAVRGVVWLPGKDNITTDVASYSKSLSAYAASLAQTYGQEDVAFIYAQPSADLVKGISPIQIKNAVSIEMNAWPKSLRDIAKKLGAAAAH